MPNGATASSPVDVTAQPPREILPRRGRLVRGRITQRCVLGAVVGTLLSLPTPTAAAGSDMELVAKADARRLFATSKPRWNQTIRHAAASGMAVPLRQSGSRLLGMSVLAHGGAVSTLLRYDDGDARPTAVLFILQFAATEAAPFTDASVHEAVGRIKDELAAEFHVVGDAERNGSGVTFFVFLTQVRPVAPRRPDRTSNRTNVGPPGATLRPRY